MEVNARPVILSVKNDSVCGSGKPVLNATASAGFINWYNDLTGGVSIDTSANNQPWQIPSTIDTTTTYYVNATNNGCTTLSRTPVLAIITICKYPPTFISRCSNIGTINLFDNISNQNKTGVWTDIDTSGALFNDSLLNLTILNNRTYEYSYLQDNNLTLLYVTVTKYQSSGTPNKETEQLSTRDIN